MLSRSALLVALLFVVLMPAGAEGATRNASSTRSYLAADYAFLHAVHSNEQAVQTNIDRLNRTFAGQCPSVGAGAPQNEEAQHMSYEVAGALWVTLYRTDADIVQTFLHAVKPLRWSDGAITRTAQGYVRSLHELSALTLPDLCGDVRAWSANGFKTVPASTAQFDRHVEAIEGKSIPLHLLLRYEQPADKGLALRTGRLETQLEHTETMVGFNDWDTLLETLALNQ